MPHDIQALTVARRRVREHLVNAENFVETFGFWLVLNQANAP